MRPTVAAPSHCFTYRKLRLPQGNQRMRRRIVQEELTFGLPLPLHQCVWDFYTQPGPEAFAVVAQESRWRAMSARWGDTLGADPEPLCYLRAALHAGVADALIVDFGASHTTWVAITGGRIEWVRTMMRGGQSLSQRIADETRVPLVEAEELKRRRGMDLPQVQQFIGELLEETLLSKPLPYRKVLLCGGGSGMPGLRAYLHTQLGVEPEPFPLPPLLSPNEHVSAFGAALSGRIGQQRLRLQVATVANPSDTLNGWLLVGASCLLLYGAILETRHSGLRQQQIRLQKEFRGASAQLGVTLPDHLKSPEQAEKWLVEQRTFRAQVKSRSVSHVADSLARAAQALREVGDCRIDNILFDDGKITLEGEAGTLLKGQQLRQRWGQIFPDLKQVGMRSSSGLRFRYHFEGKIPQ